MTELVDVSDLGSDVERRVGSSPTIRTNKSSRSSVSRVVAFQAASRGFEPLREHYLQKHPRSSVGRVADF